MQNHLEMVHTKFEISGSGFTYSRVLQACWRTAAGLLQIMKAHYLVMLHAEFEVSRSHRLGARRDYIKLTPPPAPPPAPAPPVTPSLRKLA